MGPRHWPSTAAPVKVDRGRVLGENPDDEPFQTALIEVLPASFEKVLAKTQALIGRRQVKLVNFTGSLPARAGNAERRVAGNGAIDFEREEVLTGSNGAPPPFWATAPDDILKVQVRNDSAVGMLPGGTENVGQGPRISEL